MIKFLLWCILLVLSWPLALLALVLYPIIWVLLLYVLVQQVENHLLVPRVQGHAVELHPAVIIMLLAIAGTVFGFIALVVIIPLVALLRELFWYADHRLRGLHPRDAMAHTHVARQLGLEPYHEEDDTPEAPETDEEPEAAAAAPEAGSEA